MTDKALEKKAGIAAAARELFAEYGYQGVTMEKVARRAGMARTTLYDYFNSREEILYFLIEDRVTAGTEPPPPGPLPFRLARCMAASLRRLAVHFDLYRILFTERPVLGEGLGTRLAEWQGKILETVGEVIQQAMDTGEYHPRGGQEGAVFLYQALLGQRMNGLILAGPDSMAGLDPEDEAEKLIDYMIRGTGGLKDGYDLH